MKKICFLVDSIFSIGGVQRVTAVIAKALSKDYHVTIVSMDDPSKKDTSFYDLHEADIEYRFFQYDPLSKWKTHFLWACSAIYRRILSQNQLTTSWYCHSSFPSERRIPMIRELQQGNYDVIIGVHAPLAARIAICKPYLYGAKLIGWVHSSYEALFKKGSIYIGPELIKYYEIQLAKLDHTIVLCQYDAQQYHFPTNVILNPLTLIPGALSKGTSKKFLAIGRLSHLHKGFDLLIQAFRLFSEKNKEWTLDIVGEGVEEESYRKMISEYGLQERITIHPFTNHIQSYYSNAQIYVLSSRWEGFGLVLVEAMAHGLPVVSSDLPTSKEIMGDFGLYFKNGDIEDLALRLEEATHINWQEKSMEALEIAKRFDINAIIPQWKRLIEE